MMLDILFAAAVMLIIFLLFFLLPVITFIRTFINRKYIANSRPTTDYIISGYFFGFFLAFCLYAAVGRNVEQLEAKNIFSYYICWFLLAVCICAVIYGTVGITGDIYRSWYEKNRKRGKE